jgi:hypothetical protein
MAALVFPATPAPGDVFPADPGTSGVTQYRWDGSKWNVVPTVVSLGSSNQGAYNQYQWPLADGSTGFQLTTDGGGNLSWALPSAPSIQVLGLLEPFDSNNRSFTLTEAGTNVPFFPNPATNLVVFLGGVPQIPVAAYTVVGNTVTFSEPPLVGSTFYAISNVIS